jgi:hypothetical protein
MSTDFWFVNLKERDHLENQGEDGRMDLTRILWKKHGNKRFVSVTAENVSPSDSAPR